MSLDRSVESQALALALRLAPLLCASIGTTAFPVQSAHAQASVSASLTSEYSLRGISLSRGRPAPQLRVDYDSPTGWYAGAMAARVSLPGSYANVQVIAYGGYAQRLSSTLSWEAGALKASFPRDQRYQYHEFYAGLASDRVGGRVYVSPSYYGAGRTVYAELNASYPLRERFTLIGHVGLFHLFRGGSGEGRNRIDLRAGVAVDLGNCILQFAVVASTPRRPGPDKARALAVSATYAF